MHLGSPMQCACGIYLILSLGIDGRAGLKCKSWRRPVICERRVGRVGRVGRGKRVRHVNGCTLTKTDLLPRDPRETRRKKAHPH